jgi:hypothetical protein
MTGPNLPTTTSTARTIPQHVDDHNAIHGIVDKFDKDAVPTAGQTLVFNGTVYVPATTTVFNVAAFGAVGTWNGSTGADDTTAILAAVTAAQAAATAFAIYFPPLPSGRYYKMTSPLPLLTGGAYVGASQSSSRIFCTSGSLLSVGSGSYLNMRFQDLGLYTSGAHLIDLGTGDLYKTDFERVTFYSAANAASWIHQNSGGNFNENRFLQCTFDRNSTASVPGIDIINSNGACNDNLWQSCLVYGHNGTGAVAFRFEGTSSSTYLYNNQFRNIVGEQNCAGLLWFFTANGLVVEDCTDEDATTNYSGHVIQVGTSGSSTLASRNIAIKRSGRLGGTLGASVFDILMPTGATRPLNVTVELPEVYPSAPTMQLPGWRTVIIGDNGSDASVISVATSDTIRTGRDTTGNRPAASGVGIGAMFYDTTLSKPIWSNGTVWKDAAGTTV